MCNASDNFTVSLRIRQLVINYICTYIRMHTYIRIYLVNNFIRATLNRLLAYSLDPRQQPSNIWMSVSIYICSAEGRRQIIF